MNAADKIAGLRRSAERLERQGSARAAAWYRDKVKEAEKEAAAAQEPRRWQK